MAVGDGSPEVTPEEEREKIREITAASEPLSKAGDTFYLIALRWWHTWLLYVDLDDGNNTNDGSSSDQPDSVNINNYKRPSPIDNSDLVSEANSDDCPPDDELRNHLREGTHYIILPGDVWNQLYAWYGGGPTLARKVIACGGPDELTVEVYPLRLHLHLMPKNATSTIRISKMETIGGLHQRAREVFHLTSEQVCIWDYYGKQKYALMNDMRKTLVDANIQMENDILVEVVGNIQENGRANNKTTSIVLGNPKAILPTNKGVLRNSNSGSSSHGRESESVYGSSTATTRGISNGLTGLVNLGNTCFMNSAIQCLVHTPEFARYFRNDYHKEINWQNPLGMVGELALAFGDLLRKLWTPARNPVTPRSFKAKLAKFAPQFSGYNQHDSQELLAFLLDGLHEDLNRVKQRPYIKSKDADGRPDEEVADEYWANHVARNDSIIVDVCQGQYKSTLVCPICSKVSVTFDPFMYLSLPLQSTLSRSMTVTVFASDGSAVPNPCTVSVTKQGRCKDLTQALSYACSLKHNEKLLLAEVKGHQIERFLEDPSLPLSSINETDHLAAYKIPKVAKNVKYLQIIHRREQQATGSSHRTGGYKQFGIPLVTLISRDEIITRGDIYTRVSAILSPMLKSENTGDSENKLPLKLIGENNALIDISVGEDKTVKFSTSSMIKVIIDWSDKLLENYDNDYLENLPLVFKFGSLVKKGRHEPITLYSCLEAFLREEPLVPEEMWYCPQCKEQRQASKKLDLWRLPEVLVIHLKRFSYSRSVKNKLETFVNFPIYNLDLTNYVANKKSARRELYELYALTNHYGGMGSGHYTAHIKLVDEDRWYNFDDNHITPLNEDDVKSAAAYVLFYKRS